MRVYSISIEGFEPLTVRTEIGIKQTIAELKKLNYDAVYRFMTLPIDTPDNEIHFIAYVKDKCIYLEQTEAGKKYVAEVKKMLKITL